MKKKIQKFRERKGMTVMELIVYLAITMIISVLIIELTSRMLQVKVQSVGSSEVTANAILLLDRLTYEMANSSLATGEYPGNSITLIVNGQPVTFELNNGQIFYQSVALTNNLVEISPFADGTYIFNQLINGSSQSIQVKFKVKYKDSNFSRDYQTTFLISGK